MSKTDEHLAELRKVTKEFIARLEARNREGKGMGLKLQVYYILFLKNGIFYNSSLIFGGYVIKRSHPSLDLNGSKIHTIYLKELYN